MASNSEITGAIAAISADRVRRVHNRTRDWGAPCSEAVRTLISEGEIGDAQRNIVAWPGYLQTPLQHLNGLAKRLDVQAIWLKDESARFGVGSFKALGGPYAMFRLLADKLNLPAGELRSAKHAEAVRQATVTCATDGNHGRAVAWAAAQMGCGCVIYIHAGVSPGREAALRRFGATVVRVSGNYDDSVRRAATDARARDWILVADTSADASDPSPRYVMAGYTLLMEEVREQLAGMAPPTHIFVQAGVGGLAAAVVIGACRSWGAARPRLVVVEPNRADCVFRSILNELPTALEGPLETVMSGLACGEVSYWAWPVLREAIDDVLTVPDEIIPPTMRLLFRGVDGDPSLIVGESGVAGLSAAIAVRKDVALAKALGLSSASRVLAIGTEGATDPDIYRQLVPNFGA